MTDPVRLLSSSRGGLARALLESAIVPEPTDAQCDALFSAIAKRLPEAVVAGATAATAGQTLAKAATSKAIGLGLLAKGAVVVGIVGSLVGVGASTGWFATREALPQAATSLAPQAQPRSPERPVVQPAPVVAPAPPVVPTPPPLAAEPVAEPIVQRAPAPRASAVRKPVAPAITKEDPPIEVESALHAESASLLLTRQMVRSGDCGAALAKLDEEGRRFPHGALAQEREVLTIEALACSGRGPAASARADAFLRAHPTSPHASALRRFTR